MRMRTQSRLARAPAASARFTGALTANLPDVDGYAPDGTANKTKEWLMGTDFDF
jgi:hypothetical protein